MCAVDYTTRGSAVHRAHETLTDYHQQLKVKQRAERKSHE